VYGGHVDTAAELVRLGTDINAKDEVGAHVAWQLAPGLTCAASRRA
jgi:hypothetical protein